MLLLYNQFESNTSSMHELRLIYDWIWYAIETAEIFFIFDVHPFHTLGDVSGHHLGYYRIYISYTKYFYQVIIGLVGGLFWYVGSRDGKAFVLWKIFLISMVCCFVRIKHWCKIIYFIERIVVTFKKYLYT